MNNKWFTIIIIMIINILPLLYGQGISVKSFRLLENDLDARAHFPKEDKNGEKAAIIKIVTTETGFEFDAGTIGIVASVQKTSEIWVYVPRGSKVLTIKHPKLGLLRNYTYPETIEAGNVYEMELVTGKLITTVEAPKIAYQFLVVSSEPADADVYINDVAVGKTEYQTELPIGKYTYRISKELYLPEAGTFELIAGTGNKKIINLTLKPDFGSLQLSSAPEKGANVSIDNIPTGKTTPCTLEKVKTGEHTITLSHDKYASVSERFTIKAGETLLKTIEMAPTFADVEINTKPQAAIYINNENKSNSGYWKGRLNQGVYTIETKLDKHYTKSEKQTVIAGQPLKLMYELLPITGTIKIKTVPYDASIKLNGEDKGTTPNTIEGLLIGDYQLVLSKNGFSTLTKTITIKENEETIVNETLSNYRSITITSTPSGARLVLNGKDEGYTPKSLTAPYGNNSIELEKNGYMKYSEKFAVTEDRGNYQFQMTSDKAAMAQMKVKKYKKRKIITFAAGSVFAGVGTYFYLQSQKHADEYPTATTNATEVYDSMEREQLLAGISFGLSAGFYTTSLVYAIKQGNNRRKMEVALTPLPGGAIIGLNMQL